MKSSAEYWPRYQSYALLKYTTRKNRNFQFIIREKPDTSFNFLILYQIYLMELATDLNQRNSRYFISTLKLDVMRYLDC